MTRVHTFAPPPHLAVMAHEHTCPACKSTYPCYGPNHTPGSARSCGGTKCRA